MPASHTTTKEDIYLRNFSSSCLDGRKLHGSHVVIGGMENSMGARAYPATGIMPIGAVARSVSVNAISREKHIISFHDLAKEIRRLTSDSRGFEQRWAIVLPKYAFVKSATYE